MAAGFNLCEKLSRRKQTIAACKDVVDFIDETISYEQFLKGYLVPNKICRLGQWATDGWISKHKWVTESGEPNTAYLKDAFSSAKNCPVANCNTHEYDAHCKTEVDFKDYIGYLEDYTKNSSKDIDCLYLKDWHFTKIFPNYKAYEVPVFFKSDWLNEFLDEHDWEKGKQCDDYRFVYMGPKGSWTPFHSDVLRSHSWSANICGTKRWIFFPPGEEDKLRDRFGQLPFDLNSPDLKDKVMYPNGVETVKRIEVIQRKGEVIFVPSGWHHQVMNLENTISINHNWINGSNIDMTWQFLCTSLRDVEREISDCRDMEGWHQQCQIILKASAGIDFVGFYTFISFIAKKRLSALNSHSGSCNCDTARSATKSVETDLKELSVNRRETQGSGELPTINQHNDCGNCEALMKGRADDFVITPMSYAHNVFDLVQIRDVLTEMFKESEFVSIAESAVLLATVTKPGELSEMINSALKERI